MATINSNRRSKNGRKTFVAKSIRKSCKHDWLHLGAISLTDILRAYYTDAGTPVQNREIILGGYMSRFLTYLADVCPDVRSDIEFCTNALSARIGGRIGGSTTLYWQRCSKCNKSYPGKSQRTVQRLIEQIKQSFKAMLEAENSASTNFHEEFIEALDRQDRISQEDLRQVLAIDRAPRRPINWWDDGGMDRVTITSGAMPDRVERVTSNSGLTSLIFSDDITLGVKTPPVCSSCTELKEKVQDLETQLKKFTAVRLPSKDSICIEEDLRI